jgi:peptidoglycan/xylan/chitin deacetylase (PgdA/CDA1 family)
MSSTEKNSNRLLAVLAFHKIGEPARGEHPTWNYVPESTFSGHLRHLEQNGWQVIDLRTFLRGLSEPETLPFRSALITFDDGYRSIFTAALPILSRFQYPAIVFVPTDFIGGLNAFDAGIEPIEPVCSWSELLELETHGISIQSHANSHRHFSALDLMQQQKELTESKMILQKRLKNSVEVFAYPYGDSGTQFSGTRKALIQTGYSAAFLYGGGVCTWPTDDPFLLPRVAMGPDTELQVELSLQREK